MAKSKSFFGPRRGSTKSLTFQVVNGQQITKERVSEVKNPKTSSQAVQRMKLAPAQKFYSAFEAVLNHAYQGVQYGNKSREHFMSLAMKQNGGPYVVKGYNGLVPGTYLVAEGNIPEVILTPNWTGPNVVTSLNISEAPASRADFVAKVIENNPWIMEGDKLTFLFVMDYNSVYYADKKQIVMKAVLSEGESDDYAVLSDTFSETEGKLDIALDDTPFTTTYAHTCAMAVIISRGTSQTKDERSNARMYVNDDIIGRFYSTEAYEIAMASYQADSNNPIGDEWYLNNFAVGEIGRVGARSVTVDGNSWQILELIITEAGVNKHYVLVNGQYCVLPSGARAPFQPSAAGLDGIPTAPWSPSYLTLFSGFNTPGADSFAAAQAARALGCELSDLKVTNVPNIAVHNGSTTLTAEIAVAFNGRRYAEGDSCVVLTLTQEGQTFPAHAYVDDGRVYNLDDLNFGKPIANCDLSVLNVATTIAADDQSFSGFPYASSGPRPAPVPPSPRSAMQQAEFLLGGTPKAFIAKVNDLADGYAFALALSPTASEFVLVDIDAETQSGSVFTRNLFQDDIINEFTLGQFVQIEGTSSVTVTSLNGGTVLGTVAYDNSISELIVKPSGNALEQICMQYGITEQQFNTTVGGAAEIRLFQALGTVKHGDPGYTGNVVAILPNKNTEYDQEFDAMGLSNEQRDSGVIIMFSDTAFQQFSAVEGTLGNIVENQGIPLGTEAYWDVLNHVYGVKTYYFSVKYDSSLDYLNVQEL